MLWYPYKQMKFADDLPTLESATGVYLHFKDGRSCIDGISSWWAVIHGYNHPDLNKALQQQAEKFSHIMLGGITHEPAQELAKTLVSITPEGLNHVFFSDSGSVGVEVALKMAIQYWRNKGKSKKVKFISLVNGYHGDTFKAMEVSDDSDFSTAFSGALQRGYSVAIPKGGFDAGDNFVKVAIQELEQLLENHYHEVAAFIVEPIVQCAGGFHIYTPEYLRQAQLLCKKYDVLMIYDEVATGFGRTGKLFAAEHVGVTPDIMILGKALTAGYLGHAATLTTSEVYNSFFGDSYEQAFMHGPTFMANPLACAVAQTGISLFQKECYLEKIAQIETFLKTQLNALLSQIIVERRIIGAIGALELKDATYLKGFNEFAMNKGVWLRPIGNILYIMPPYIIEKRELLQIIEVIDTWLKQFKA